MTDPAGAAPPVPDAVQVSPAVSALVLDEGRRRAPDEACGLLVGRRVHRLVQVLEARPCENTAEPGTRHERFELDPRQVIEVERALRGSGREVVGFYHSHPVSDAVPSKVDRPFMALWPEMVWLIVGNAEDPRRALLRVWSIGHGDPGIPAEVPIQIPA